MAIKAIIFDLDNTIYPVHSIGEALFEDLFMLLEESRELGPSLEDVKKEIMRRPFQMVAKDFGFSESLTRKGIDHLRQLEYKGPIEPFPDFALVSKVSLPKYLVTTGFRKLQDSKVDGMKLRNQFLEVHIVDPLTSSETKKDVFGNILKMHGYETPEVLVIGDDPASEIKAGIELGLPVLMYDALGLYPDTSVQRITHYAELLDIIS